MKLIVPYKELKRACGALLPIVQRHVALRASLARQAILVEATHDSVFFSATNLDVYARVRVHNCVVEKPGKVLLYAHCLGPCIDSDGDSVVISVGSDIVISSHKTVVKMSEIPLAEYPETPRVDECVASVGAHTLRDAISIALAHTRSSDRGMQAYTCAYFCADHSGSLLVAGTDGYRLSRCTLSARARKEMTALVHRASLQHVCRLLGSASKDDVVELGYQGTSLAFRVDADIEIVVRTVDAQYPNINHVIRRSLQKVHTCCVSTHELRLAVERIHAALVDPAEDPLIVEFRGDGLVLQSRAAEWGHVSTVLPLVTHADTRGTRIAFSVNLLHSSVRAIEQVVPQIELCYGDATSPLVMRADDSVMHILTLLMPRVLSD